MSEIEKYYNGEIHVDFEEIPIERKSWEELSQEIIEQHNEIERLKSIIKEVREYIDENVFHSKNQEEQELYDIALLEILDKVGDEK